MKTRWWLTILLIGCFTLPGSVNCEDMGYADLPWEKAYLNAGGFFATLDSGFRVGERNLGLGVELDVEEALGLDSTDSSFRIDGGWRFTENKRHKLELGWFAFHREASGLINDQIDVPPELGGGTIGPGEVKTEFNFDIIRIMYDYSLILDDRLDLNLGFGFFVMPIDFGVQAIVNGVGAQSLVEDITAPLPVIGLGVDLALTPKWFLRQKLELFYLEIGDFQGDILSATLALEYLPWQHVGFGLAADGKSVHIEANGSDYPFLDFRGNVEFSYIGALVYIKFFL